MRLRQLGTTQSIVFLSPPEVHQSILDLRKKTAYDSVDSSDVIFWLLEQTCSSIEQLQPLYYSQGVDFCRRTQAALDNKNFLADSKERSRYLKVLQQKEQQTLEQLYIPKPKSKLPATAKMSLKVSGFIDELKTQRKGFQDSGNAVHGSALQEVEQEREVAFEVEAVREVQKPTHYSPLSFSGLHPDILCFVRIGRLLAGNRGYEHVFAALRRTPPGKKHGISSESFTSKFFVSHEFTRTVRLPVDRSDSSFLVS